MFASLFTAMLSAVRGLMRAFNLQTEIVLTDHKIKIKAVNPTETEKYWDNNIWTYGNIYLQDFANPIDIRQSVVEDKEYDLITTERYKTFMEQTLIDDMLQASKTDGLTLKQALIAILATNILTVGLVYLV